MKVGGLKIRDIKDSKELASMSLGSQLRMKLDEQQIGLTTKP